LFDDVGFDGFLGCLETDAWYAPSSAHESAACSPSPKSFFTTAAAS
jgi:hypothetical protein